VDGGRKHWVRRGSQTKGRRPAFREVWEGIVELGAEAVLAVSADAVHQLVQEDGSGTGILPVSQVGTWMQAGSLHHAEKLADDLTAGGGLGFIVLGHEGEVLLRRLASGRQSKLPGDAGPGGLAQWRAIVAASAFDGVELVSNKDGRGVFGDFLDPGSGEDLGHAGPAVGGGAVSREVEQEFEGMGTSKGANRNLHTRMGSGSPPATGQAPPPTKGSPGSTK